MIIVGMYLNDFMLISLLLVSWYVGIILRVRNDSVIRLLLWLSLRLLVVVLIDLNVFFMVFSDLFDINFFIGSVSDDRVLFFGLYVVMLLLIFWRWFVMVVIELWLMLVMM